VSAMRMARILGWLGRLLLGLGVLLLLFTAFQLWGTGFFEARSQSQLRENLSHQLPANAAAKVEALRVAPALSPPVLAPDTAAPPVGQAVGVLQIPTIGLDQAIVEGVGPAQLRQGPGHYPGTPLPGQAGNVGLAGHRTTYAHPFYNLNEVTLGTKIDITTPQGIFLYTATNMTTVLPTQVTVLAPTKAAILTLTTCNPRYSAALRLVVRAKLTSSLLFRTHEPTTPTTAPTGSSAPKSSTALAGDGAEGDWTPALAWGIATLLVGLAVLFWARRSRRHRSFVYAGGGIVILLVLFFFFASLSPLLPASF
jgi:sortase A